MKSTDNQVKARPVNWTSDEVRAALEGRKTQMRVSIKYLGDSPEFIGSMHCEESEPANWGWDMNTENGREFPTVLDIECPFGKVGDRLWVRETWKIGAWHEDDGTFAVDYKASPELTKTPWIYIADDEEFEKHWVKVTDELDAIYYPTSENGRYYWEAGKSPLKWKSPVTMPRWASRLLLEIVDVRVERLQGISKEDTKAEGFAQDLTMDDKTIVKSLPLLRFVSRWNERNIRHQWKTNPWVWVIDFKVLEGA